jgi:hypothetical protein
MVLSAFQPPINPRKILSGHPILIADNNMAVGQLHITRKIMPLALARRKEPRSTVLFTRQCVLRRQKIGLLEAAPAPLS